MAAMLDCPAMECWPALFGGSLPEQQRECCERHLEACPSCQERLDHLEEFGAALRSRARRLGDPTATPHEPALSRVLGRLHCTRSLLSTDACAPADLRFLRPSDRADNLGTLGRYEVREVIGQGGMGVVLKAFDPTLCRLVAIKVMAGTLAGSTTARRRFTREARAAAAVGHEHVVTVHGVHEADGLPYLVMEYVAGESLQARLDRAGPLETSEVVRIGRETAQGLAAAHAQGLVHRDIKPANLLLEGESGRVKITDFGLARAAEDVPLTQHGVVAGTPEYMAPEQARGERADHRADIYALGSVLYAMCTGEPPFRGEAAAAVLCLVGDQPPGPVRLLNANVPEWLEAVIVRSMAKDPAKRYQTAAEMGEALEGHLADGGQTACEAVPPATRRRRPLWLAGLFAAATTAALCWRLLAGGAPAANDAPAHPGPLPGQIYLDFRGSNLLPPGAALWTGTDGDEVIEPGEKGLRITVPADRKRTDPVGLVINGPFPGNFDITTAYEIIQSDQPRRGGGVGYEMYVTTSSPGREAIALARVKQSDGRETYACSRMTTNGQGKRDYNSLLFPASEPTGRLRLTRSQTEVTCWAADGDTQEFQELCRLDLGDEELKYVRLCAYTGHAPESVDVRIVDVRIGSDQPLPEIAQAAPAASGGMAKGVALPVALGLALAVGFIALGAWFFYGRRDRGAGGTISFTCPVCGAGVKAPAQQVGRKGKCPQCGKAVAVPGIGKNT
jgi:hypothetical protein